MTRREDCSTATSARPEVGRRETPPDGATKFIRSDHTHYLIRTRQARHRATRGRPGTTRGHHNMNPPPRQNEQNQHGQSGSQPGGFFAAYDGFPPGECVIPRRHMRELNVSPSPLSSPATPFPSLDNH